jgi:hypothetical protein
MTKDEMVEILEEIIRDSDSNPTARCTAIRTLREIEPQDRTRTETSPTSTPRGRLAGRCPDMP